MRSAVGEQLHHREFPRIGSKGLLPIRFDFYFHAFGLCSLFDGAEAAVVRPTARPNRHPIMIVLGVSARFVTMAP